MLNHRNEGRAFLRGFNYQVYPWYQLCLVLFNIKIFFIGYSRQTHKWHFWFFEKMNEYEIQDAKDTMQGFPPKELCSVSWTIKPNVDSSGKTNA